MPDLNDAKRLLLAEWEAKRNELDTLIAALRREMGIAATETLKPDAPIPMPTVSPSGINVNDLVRPGDFFGMSQVDAIQQFLSRTNRQGASLQEIAAALFRGKATSVLLEGEKKLRNLSSGLSKSDIFHSVAKNRWGLSEWYPNRVLQRDRKGAKSNGQPADQSPNSPDAKDQAEGGKE